MKSIDSLHLIIHFARGKIFMEHFICFYYVFALSLARSFLMAKLVRERARITTIDNVYYNMAGLSIPHKLIVFIYVQ